MCCLGEGQPGDCGVSPDTHTRIALSKRSMPSVAEEAGAASNVVVQSSAISILRSSPANNLSIFEVRAEKWGSIMFFKKNLASPHHELGPWRVGMLLRVAIGCCVQIYSDRLIPAIHSQKGGRGEIRRRGGEGRAARPTCASRPTSKKARATPNERAERDCASFPSACGCFVAPDTLFGCWILGYWILWVLDPRPAARHHALRGQKESGGSGWARG